MIIGGHYFGVYTFNDFKKIIEHVKKIGATACQIFVGNESKTTLKYKAIFSNDDFIKAKKLLRDNNITLVIHGNLTLNFANPMTSGRYRWMADNIKYDMNFAQRIGAIGCVIHTGYKTNVKNEREAIKNMATNIDNIIGEVGGDTKIIIETSAGQKNRIATKIEELADLYNKIENKERVGFCVDSCHIFSSGYPINTLEGINEYFTKFDEMIGCEKIIMAHLNDSKTELNSRLNRHENLMYGYIFKNRDILKEYLKYIRDKIIILETRQESKYMNEIKLIKKIIK
jgi:apurinic endonuclease APN1